MKRPDIYSGNLFEDSPNKGNFLLLPDGIFLDSQGNTVDAQGNLLKEAPSAELLKARELYPDWSDNDLNFYIIPILKRRKSKQVH